MHQPGQYEYKVFWDEAQDTLSTIMNDSALEGWQFVSASSQSGFSYVEDGRRYLDEGGLWVIMQRVRIDEPEGGQE